MALFGVNVEHTKEFTILRQYLLEVSKTNLEPMAVIKKVTTS